MTASGGLRDKVLPVLALILMIVTIYMILIFAPIPGEDPDSESVFSSPDAQRIFYLHLPSAIVSYIAFTIVFGASIVYLIKKTNKADIIAAASAEIGIIFCTITLFTGSLWGKGEWGVYWRWGDIRLVTFLVLWLIFAAYLGLRNSIEEPEARARLASVFGIVGFVGVPLSYFSMYIWQTLHPIVISPGGGGLNREMGFSLLVSFTAFIFIYISLMMNRIKIAKLEQKMEDLKAEMEGIIDG